MTLADATPTVSAGDLAVLGYLLAAMCLLFTVAPTVGWWLNRIGNRHPEPPKPSTSHVRPIQVGTCRGCGNDDVPVEPHRAHALLDPEPHCRHCLTGVPA